MSGLMLTKLVTQLLLPPGGLILLAFTGYLARRRWWWGRVLLILSLAALWLLSTVPLRDALTGPLEYASPPLRSDTIAYIKKLPVGTTAIVLLGGGIYEQAPEYDGSDELAQFAMMRTIYAADIAQQTDLPVYATGGRPLSQARESEGAVMRRWLLRFGLAGELVFAEEASENTWQNAIYLKQTLQSQGISRVVLVTSAWHMPRSLWCFEQQGFEVIAAPTEYLTKQSTRDARSLLPDAGVLAESSLALHEYLGLVWYRLRYAAWS